MADDSTERLDGTVDDRNVAAYVRELGLVDGGDDVQVEDLSARNRVFTVAAGGKKVVVKQAAFSEDRAAIVHEARILDRLARARSGPTPRVLACDRETGTLVVDAIADAEPLRDRLDPSGRVAPPLAAALADALAAVHEVPQPPALPSPPRALSPHRIGPDELRVLSAANLELLLMLQRARPLCDALDALRAEWRPKTLIHGDVRWENCVVVPGAGGRDDPLVRLVDWERSGAGDPRIDLGAVAGELLWGWLDSMPVGQDLNAERAVAAATLPLDAVARAARAFFGRYAARRGLRRRALTIDAVRFSAARLVEGAFERTAEALRLDARPVLALQLAANVMLTPGDAARTLLGLAEPPR